MFQRLNLPLIRLFFVITTAATSTAALAQASAQPPESPSRLIDAARSATGPERLRLCRALLDLVLPETQPHVVMRMPGNISGRSTKPLSFEPSVALALVEISIAASDTTELITRLRLRHQVPAAAADAAIITWQLAVLSQNPQLLAEAAAVTATLQPIQLTPVSLEVLAFWIDAAATRLPSSHAALCTSSLEKLLPAALAVPASPRCSQHLAGLAFRLARTRLLEDQPTTAASSLHVADVLAERAAAGQPEASTQRSIAAHHREVARLLVLAGTPADALRRLQLCRQLLTTSTSAENDASELARLAASLPHAAPAERYELLLSLLTAAEGNRLVMPAAFWPVAAPHPTLAQTLPTPLQNRWPAQTQPQPISPLSELVDAAVHSHHAEALETWLIAAAERGNAPARLALALLMLQTGREEQAKQEFIRLLQRRRINDVADLRVDETLLLVLQLHPAGSRWLFETDLSGIRPEAWALALQALANRTDPAPAPLVWCTDPEFGRDAGPLVHPATVGANGLLLAAAPHSSARLVLPWPVVGPLTFSGRILLQPGMQAGIGFDTFAAISAAGSNRTLATGSGAQAMLVRSGRYQKPGEFGWQSVEADSGGTLFIVNGHPLWKIPGADAAFPWLLLHVESGGIGAFSQLRISAPVKIPQELPLSASPELSGWSAVRYGQLLPINRHLPLIPTASSSGQPTPTSNRAATASDWTAADDTITARTADDIGNPGEIYPVGQQSLIQYQRPLRPGETLTWEFFFQPGTAGDCIALGSVGIRVRTEGVFVHSLPVNSDQWTLFPPSREHRLPSNNSLTLEQGWNRAQLEIQQGRAVLFVNDQQTAELPLPPNTDTRPGLSCCRCQPPIQVRRIRLRGDWPAQLTPELLQQTLTQTNFFPRTTSPQPNQPLPKPLLPVLEESIQRLRASDVVENSRALESSLKLAALKDWILPPAPTALRVSAEPHNTDLEELIRTAIASGQLPQLELQLSERSALDITDRVAQTAALALCALLEPSPNAVPRLQQLLELLQQNPRNSRDVSGLLFRVAVHAAAQDSLQHLALQLLESPPMQSSAARLQAQASDIDELRTRLMHAAFARNGTAADFATPLTTKATPESVATQLQSWTTQELKFVQHTPDTQHTAAWLPLADGTVLFTSGSARRLLCFPKPLTGNFSCEISLRTTAAGETPADQLPLLGFGGVCWEVDSSGTIHEFPWREPPQLSADGQTPDTIDSSIQPVRCQYRLERQGNELRLQQNGRILLQQTLTGREPPWLVLRSGRRAGAVIEGLKLEYAESQLPAIPLAFNPTLLGWSQPVFQTEPGFHPEKPTDADWRVDETRLTGAFRSEAAGSWRPSLLQHLLPLPARATINYSFYFDPATSLVHPTIDGSVLLLEPGDGIYIAQLPQILSPSYILAHKTVLAASQRIAGSHCNPIAGQWNQLQLVLDESGIQLRINDQPAGTFTLSQKPHRKFGLFHWSDQTNAQVQSLNLQIQ